MFPSKIGRRILCYAFFVITVICLHSQSFESVQEFVFSGKDETRNFLLEVSMAWLNARCLSFSLDCIHSNSLNRKDFLVSLAYFFYLPCFFTGPLKNYSNFYKCISSYNSVRPFNVTHFLLNLIRFIFWALVYDFLLHFVYCSSIQYNQLFITEMNSWSLSGFGYSLPCLFYLKYFVIYGLAGVISSLNGVHLEAPPKCISRVHLCSYLWRHFDRGLHLWLSTYFYKPIVNNNWNVKRKVIATAVCFCCVAVWHGFNKSILVWSFLSFLGVIVELFVTSFLSGFGNIKKKISSDSLRRLEAVITAPLFMFLILSNIFFLSNFDIGIHFLRTFVFSFSTTLFIALFIMYCSCNVSIFCKRKEDNL
ncbi:protein-cysteine N-palmitoyltransferase HHAT-like protein [Leptotrombidium deliense]|uniref:Protein-cysteine N-palmitoyltransferase HHAT-like protein n=1 Tax=Leptotrombidium deliense TaxID=299467 RepID=A0A443S6K4_9ACAR|nr:protein-cysteine N-palmitoyltransferase HHAT-like protein [Leptotrombidium deliense]